MALGTDKGGGRHAAKLFEGFAEVIDIREIQGLCDLADREVFVGQKKLLGFFDAAVLAGVAVGVFADAEEAARKCVKQKRTVMPNLENSARYAEIFETYKRIVEVLAPIYRERTE